jgi:mono/diheme cytochrome c family protein
MDIAIRWNRGSILIGLLVMAAGCADSGKDSTTGASTEPATGSSGVTSVGATAGDTTAGETTNDVPTSSGADSTGNPVSGTSTSGSTSMGGTTTNGGTTTDGGTSTDGTTTNGGTSTGGDPEYVMVYQANCMPCHGDTGQGIEPLGPEIRHVHPLMAAYLVRNGDNNTTMNAKKMLVGHPGVMPAFTTDQVSDAVLQEIVAWLQEFPQPVDGKALFVDHCAFCHGTKGGTDIEYASAFHNLPFKTSGDSDTLPEFIARVRSGHVVDAMMVPVLPSKRRAYMPPFGPEMLTDAEITLMEAWARLQ